MQGTNLSESSSSREPKWKQSTTNATKRIHFLLSPKYYLLLCLPITSGEGRTAFIQNYNFGIKILLLKKALVKFFAISTEFELEIYEKQNLNFTKRILTQEKENKIRSNKDSKFSFITIAWNYLMVFVFYRI